MTSNKVKAFSEGNAALAEEFKSGRHDNEESIFDLPNHPSMDYEELFGEPEAYKTDGLGQYVEPGMTKVFGGAFNYVQSTIYYILVMITGLFLGSIWGIVFGILIYLINWVVHPVWKIAFLLLRLLQSLIRAVVRTMLDPFFQAIGTCFGGIKGFFNVSLTGMTLGVNKALPHAGDVIHDV